MLILREGYNLFFFREVPLKGKLKKYNIDDYYGIDREKQLSVRFSQLLPCFSKGLSIYVHNILGILRVDNNFIIDTVGGINAELMPGDDLYNGTIGEEGWIGITLKDKERFISALEKLWFSDYELDLFLVPAEYWGNVNNIISSLQKFKRRLREMDKLVIKLAQSEIEPIFSRGHDGMFIELLVSHENPVREKILRSIIAFPLLGRLEVYRFDGYLLTADERLSKRFAQLFSLFPPGLAIFIYNISNSLIVKYNTIVDVSEKSYVRIFPGDVIYNNSRGGEGWIGLILMDINNFLMALDHLWFNELDLEDFFLIPVEYWSKVNNIISESFRIADPRELINKLKEEVEPIFIRGEYGRYVELLISPDNPVKEKILKLVLN